MAGETAGIGEDGMNWPFRRGQPFALTAGILMALLPAADYHVDFADVIGRGLALFNPEVRGRSVLLKPNMVEYEPSTIFNKAALDAALKFKYKPRIVNGEAIEVHGVLNKITFKLED